MRWLPPASRSLVASITAWTVLLGPVWTARGEGVAPETDEPPAQKPAAAEPEAAAPAVDEAAAEEPASPESAPQEAGATATDVDLEQLYATGERRFADGDYPGAIAAFATGLAQIGPDHDRRLRAYFAVSLAIAHLKVHERDLTEADLLLAHDLLAETVRGDAEILAREPELEALARRHLARANAALDERRKPPPAAAMFDDDPAPSSTDAHGTSPDAKDPRRAQGLGLLLTGTALAVGSVALFIEGATLERRALAIAEDPPDGAQKDYIDEEVPRLRRIRYAIAGPALTVGAAFLIAGGILLRRAGTPRRTTLVPAVSPDRAALTITTRF